MAIKLKPIQRKVLSVTIQGTSPLIQHSWAEKARKQMRDKKEGRKTKTREVCIPEEECEAATHRTEDGQYGIPAGAIKQSLINAAHKDIGIEKTLVRKSLFVLCSDANNTIPMRCGEPVMREDCVRVGQGGTDLRYRPEFPSGWESDISIEFDAENLRPDDIVNLLDRAGFGVGLLEMRPQKGGDYGRFQVKTN